MIDTASKRLAWTNAPPEGARPLRELLLSHPFVIRSVETFAGRRGVIRRADAEQIEVVHCDGDRGFVVTQNGFEPWKLDPNASDEEGSQRWLEIVLPWETEGGIFGSIWSLAIYRFDGLLRSGRLEIAGRFDSFRSPCCYIPPGAIGDEDWGSLKVDYAKGSIVLNNGEIVYDVHIVDPRPKEGMTDDGPWTVAELASWIREGIRRSPERPTFTKTGLLKRMLPRGMTEDQVQAAWDEAVPADSAYRRGGFRPDQQYPGID